MKKTILALFCVFTTLAWSADLDFADIQFFNREDGSKGVLGLTVKYSKNNYPFDRVVKSHEEAKKILNQSDEIIFLKRLVEHGLESSHKDAAHAQIRIRHLTLKNMEEGAQSYASSKIEQMDFEIKNYDGKDKTLIVSITNDLVDGGKFHMSVTTCTTPNLVHNDTSSYCQNNSIGGHHGLSTLIQTVIEDHDWRFQNDEGRDPRPFRPVIEERKVESETQKK